MSFLPPFAPDIAVPRLPPDGAGRCVGIGVVSAIEPGVFDWNAYAVVGVQGTGVPRPVKAAALQDAHEAGSVVLAPDPAAPHRREGPEGRQRARDDIDQRLRLRLEQVGAEVTYPAAVQADARTGWHGRPLGDLHLARHIAPFAVSVLHHRPQVLLDEFSGH